MNASVCIVNVKETYRVLFMSLEIGNLVYTPDLPKRAVNHMTGLTLTSLTCKPVPEPTRPTKQLYYLLFKLESYEDHSIPFLAFVMHPVVKRDTTTAH